MIHVIIFNSAAIALLRGEMRVALPEIYNSTTSQMQNDVSAGFIEARQIPELFGAATFVFPCLRGRLK